MEKAITLLTICLLMIAGIQISYAQDVDTAETFAFDPPSIPDNWKPENIAWIKKTLKTCCTVISEYSVYAISNVEVNHCTISWKVYESNPDVDQANYQISIDLTRAGNWSYSENGDIIADSAVIKKRDLSGYDKDTYANSFHLNTKRDSIAQKLAIAFDLMASLCEQ